LVYPEKVYFLADSWIEKSLTDIIVARQKYCIIIMRKIIADSNLVKSEDYYHPLIMIFING